MVRSIATLAALSALALVAAPAQATGDDVRTHVSGHSAGGWKPHFRAARKFARSRSGDVRIAVIDQFGRINQLNGSRTAPMASLFKALLLATYLSQPGVRHRSLRESERDLLGPMIRRSDNAAATRVRDMLGPGPIVAMTRKARMKDFSYKSVWGLSRTSARDQARFFYRWDRFVPKRHERYARYLLSHIVPSQRWGFGRARPKGWSLFFKGGWGVGTGRVNHQTALLEEGRCRLGISVMTEFSPSHGYGTRTIEGVAERLTRGIGQAHCGGRFAEGPAQADPNS